MIYVIVESGGSYDDAWQSNVIASHDREALEAHMVKLKEAMKQHDQLVEELYEFRTKWDATSPQPELEAILPYYRFPKGLGKKDITQQMRDERNLIESKNLAIGERNQLKLTARFQAYIAAQREFLIAKGVNPEAPENRAMFELMWHAKRDSTFNIEEVPEL